MEFITLTSTFTHFGNAKLPHCKSQLYLEKIAEIASSSSVVLYLIQKSTIMVYYRMPYVGMGPNKNGGHIKSAQMTCSKCLR